MTATEDVLSLLKRELVHAVLAVVFLNPEFMEIYKNGLVRDGVDNIQRRYFPRIMTYSMDHLERYGYLRLLLIQINK